MIIVVVLFTYTLSFLSIKFYIIIAYQVFKLFVLECYHNNYYHHGVDFFKYKRQFTRRSKQEYYSFLTSPPTSSSSSSSVTTTGTTKLSLSTDISHRIPKIDNDVMYRFLQSACNISSESNDELYDIINQLFLMKFKVVLPEDMKFSQMKYDEGYNVTRIFHYVASSMVDCVHVSDTILLFSYSFSTSICNYPIFCF